MSFLKQQLINVLFDWTIQKVINAGDDITYYKNYIVLIKDYVSINILYRSLYTYSDASKAKTEIY